MWVSLCLLSSCGCADPASAGNRDPDAVCSGVELFQVFVPVFAAVRRAVPVSVLQQLLPYFPVISSAPLFLARSSEQESNGPPIR